MLGTPGTAALGCRATAATGGRCAPGASRTAGRGEDCTGPRGCRKVRRVVSRERAGNPRGWRNPAGKGNMTDERIDPIGSVTPEPTCTECRRRPRWAGSLWCLWCEPCYVRLGIMDGTAAFSDAMARLGESAS